MPKNVVIYHNPRCTKSRQALALLRENGVEPTIVEYLKSPPTVADVKSLIAALGIAPHELLRTKEAAYSERGLSQKSSAAAVAAAIASDPLLLERPVVVAGNKAVLGRPPERVLELL
jgi:arsenate reductase